MNHKQTCPAYGNYQPPYEECNCGADTAVVVVPHRISLAQKIAFCEREAAGCLESERSDMFLAIADALRHPPYRDRAARTERSRAWWDQHKARGRCGVCHHPVKDGAFPQHRECRRLQRTGWTAAWIRTLPWKKIVEMSDALGDGRRKKVADGD